MCINICIAAAEQLLDDVVGAERALEPLALLGEGVGSDGLGLRSGAAAGDLGGSARAAARTELRVRRQRRRTGGTGYGRRGHDAN